MQLMSRRTALTAFAGAAALLVTGFPVVAAQDASPVPSAFADYPVLNVSITDDSYVLDTDKVPAGNVAVVITNNSSQPTSAGVLGPGPGMTMEDLQNAAATPQPQDEMPSFFYDITILGGPGEIAPGDTSEVLVTMKAGDWVVWGEGNQPPSFVTAVEGPDSNTTNPAADVEIQLGDFFFNGLQGLSSGEQMWHLTNVGKQPHMLVVGKVPDGTTGDQVMATMMSQDGATPMPGALAEEDFQSVSAGVILLSSGQSFWEPVNLEPGTYAALCFVTDPNTGQPHVMEGMYTVFTIGM